MATHYEILGRLKARPFRSNGLDQFETRETGSIPNKDLLTDPTWAYCCVESQVSHAFFIQTPEGHDPAKAPFYYMDIYDHAMAVATMPVERFETLASQIAWPKGVTFVQSTGRCGSTLISKVFEAIPGVLSLSEPDDITQILFELQTGVIDEPTALRLIALSTRWRGAAIPDGRLVLKTRGSASMISPLIQEAIPQSKNLFMYRSAEAFARSTYRMTATDRQLRDPEKLLEMQNFYSRFNPLISEFAEGKGLLEPMQVQVLNWIQRMEFNLEVLSSGLAFRGLRYEDLVARPKQVLEQVFEFLELPVADWAPVLAVLDRDSQEGSPLSREKLKVAGDEVPADIMERSMEMVRSRPRLGDPDIVLPGTLRG